MDSAPRPKVVQVVQRGARTALRSLRQRHHPTRLWGRVQSSTRCPPSCSLSCKVELQVRYVYHNKQSADPPLFRRNGAERPNVRWCACFLVFFFRQLFSHTPCHAHPGDLDLGVFDSLAGFDEATQLEIVDIFAAKDLSTIRNKTGSAPFAVLSVVDR